MNEKVKNGLEKVKTTVKKISKKVWILAAVAVVAIAVAVAVYLNTRPYSVLITGSTSEEISAVLSWLDAQGEEDYILRGSDTILVPESRETVLKARLLMEGYPKTGSSYETYFENSGVLSTESERNTALLLATADKIESVLRSMEGIVDASVLLTPGEDRSYVLDSGNVINAKASVIVTLREGEKLSATQAAGIRNFVANSAQGLQVDAVTLLDTWGNTYNNMATDSADFDQTVLKMQLEEEQANKVRTQVMQALGRLYGEENVLVAVNCVVDLDTREIDEYEVWIPEGYTDGKGIIGSRAYSYVFNASDDVLAGGLVGSEANADIPTEVEQEPGLDDTNGQLSGSGQDDYVHSNRTTHTYRTTGILSDCTVAVTINSREAGNVDIARMREHVAAAAGIVPQTSETMTADQYLQSKISIYAGEFNVSEPTEPDGPSTTINLFGFEIPKWVLLAAAAGVLLFVVLLVLLILSLRKRKKKKQQRMLTEQEAAEQEAAAVEELLASVGISPETAEATGADVMDLQTEKSMALRQDIRKFADENPEIAAQLVKTWLRGGDESG